MAKYLVSTQNGGTPQAMSSSFKTLVALVTANSNPAKFAVTELLLSAVGALVTFDISQETAGGSSSSVDPIPLDANDPFPFTKAFVNYSSEGVITANSSVFYLATSAAFKWEAAPGSELVTIGGTTQLGLALRAKSATYTGNCPAIVTYKE